MTRKALPLLSTLLLIGCMLSCTNAQYDWARWRGPNADGISMETDWNPAALNDLKVLWETNVGNGFSPVSIAGNRLYTMGNKLVVSGGDSATKDFVYCLDPSTGREIWSSSYDCLEGGWPGTRVSPTVDGSRIYTLSRAGHLYCLDANTGDVIWNRNIVEDSIALEPDWGFSGSPVVHGDRLILNAGKAGLALDKSTGDVVWKSELDKNGFATPVIYGKAPDEKIAVFSRLDLFAVDAATGRIEWTISWKTPYEENIADPIIEGNHMFISSGYRRGCTLIDFSGPEPVQVYEHKEMCNHHTNCLLVDGHLYGIHGNAMKEASLRCMNLMSGEIIWEKPFEFSSMIAADGKLIILTESGKLHIGAFSPDGYEEISSAQVLTIEDRPNTAWHQKCSSWTPPVLANGKIYVRNNYGDLRCIDVSM